MLYVLKYGDTAEVFSSEKQRSKRKKQLEMMEQKEFQSYADVIKKYNGLTIVAKTAVGGFQTIKETSSEKEDEKVLYVVKAKKQGAFITDDERHANYFRRTLSNFSPGAVSVVPCYSAKQAVDHIGKTECIFIPAHLMTLYQHELDILSPMFSDESDAICYMKQKMDSSTWTKNLVLSSETELVSELEETETPTDNSDIYIPPQPSVKIQEKQETPSKDTPVKTAKYTCYVDGSYSTATERCGFGVVILNGEIPVGEYSRGVFVPALKQMRNVGGEISAAQFAVDIAIHQGAREIDIFYDYMGIEKWATGEWSAHTAETQEYADFMHEACKKAKIRFEHVKSHSGNKWNEKADKLAKKATK